MWRFNEDIAVHDDGVTVIVRRVKLIKRENPSKDDMSDFKIETEEIYSHNNSNDATQHIAMRMVDIENQFEKALKKEGKRNFNKYRDCDYCGKQYKYSDPRSMYCSDTHKQYAKKLKRREREAKSQA